MGIIALKGLGKAFTKKAKKVQKKVDKFAEKEIKGAVVTMISQYPRKKYLDMLFTGGIELENWKEPMLDLLQKWAFDNKCDGIESTGRPGWAKIFKANGHKPLWHTYELPAANAGLGDING